LGAIQEIWREPLNHDLVVLILYSVGHVPHAIVINEKARAIRVAPA
jgi:hypothetical protein